MVGEFGNIKISGIATAIPENAESLLEYGEVLGEKRVKKQIRLTGIERRHLPLPGQKVSDLGAAAAKELLDRLDWKKEDIRILVVVTQTPDYQLPATAMVIHKHLELSKDCIAFDVNLGCSGYTAGIQIVAGLMQVYQGRALLIVGDVECFDEERRGREEFKSSLANWILFGNGMTATALESEDNHQIRFMQGTDGSGYLAIHKFYDHMTQMDGSEVFSFTINQVADSIREFKGHYGITEDMVDYYVFHQAQDMILGNLADICGIDMEKVLLSLKEYGNTSSASIPLTLCANEEKLKKKDKVNLFLCGFGVGLSWGCVYLQMDTKNIFPIVETDKCFGAE